MSAEATEGQGRPARARELLGHPKGLAVLALTEGWIGFSYYGMLSLLVLYMTSELLKSGHVDRVIGFSIFQAGLQLLYGPVRGQPLASAITGLYGALAYATPILGGLIADRLLGRTLTVVTGAVLMTAGHIMMAFEPMFLIALVCIVAGIGCLGALKAQVGDLYARDDRRRSDAFQIVTVIYTIGVIAAPLVCGALGEGIAWRWGFAAAGLGMFLGLLVYLAGLRWLPPDPRAELRSRQGPAERLTPLDARRLLILAALLPVLALSAVGNMEIYNAYLIWGKAHYQLSFFGQGLPVSWLVSLDSFIGTAILVASVLFWKWWRRRRREPEDILKMALGALVSALAPLILAFASWQTSGTGKVGLAYGLAFHVINAVGFYNLYPVGLALYSRLAPPRLGATVVNAYALHIFLANLLVGKLAGLLARLTPTTFWLIHAGLIACAGLILLICARLFARPLALRTEALGQI